MKIFIFAVIALISSAIVIVFLFGGIDSAMEIDNLKEHVKLQKKELHFLAEMTKSAISTCKLSVADFEKSARTNGRNILWKGDDGLVGGFKVTKKDSCITSIDVADWL